MCDTYNEQVRERVIGVNFTPIDLSEVVEDLILRCFFGVSGFVIFGSSKVVCS